MTKKIKSTCSNRFESLSPKRKKEFEIGLRDFALSELILALMEQDDISVRKLAKIAGISPTVVQAMRSDSKKDFNMQSFFKILSTLGCKLVVERDGQLMPLEMPYSDEK